MVIPKEFRNYILKELHNSPTSGHLGVKTQGPENRNIVALAMDDPLVLDAMAKMPVND